MTSETTKGVPAAIRGVLIVCFVGTAITLPGPAPTAAGTSTPTVPSVSFPGASSSASTASKRVSLAAPLSTDPYADLISISPLAPESSDQPLSARCDAMLRLASELARKNDDRLLGFLRTELDADRPVAWTVALISALDEIDFAGPEWIATLVSLATSLDQNPQREHVENSLLTAIHMLGGLCRGPQNAQLLSLLNSTSLRVRQGTLQALANSFSFDATDPGEVTTDRLFILATKFLDADVLLSPDVIAFAANTYTAALLANSRRAEDLTEKVVALKRPSLQRLVVAQLTRVQPRRPDVAEVLARLRPALA